MGARLQHANARADSRSDHCILSPLPGPAAQGKGLQDMTNTPARKIYRADHPGSFIRPAKLRKARIERSHGRITAETLRQIEDEAIPAADVTRVQVRA